MTALTLSKKDKTRYTDHGNLIQYVRVDDEILTRDDKIVRDIGVQTHHVQSKHRPKPKGMDMERYHFVSTPGLQVTETNCRPKSSS